MLSTAPASRRFRHEVRKTAILAAPLALGHLASGLIGLVNNVIAGHHSTNTLAGVAVGSAVFWLPLTIPMGVLMALPPSVSQLDGAGRQAEIGPLFQQALWLGLLLGMGLMGLQTLTVLALGPMGIAADVRPAAEGFLYGIRWGIPGLSLYFALRYLSEGMHWTWPTMVFGFGGLLVLVPLGYVFTFGKLGLPEMGAAGLGHASSIMMWAQASGFALYLARARRFAGLGLFARFAWPRWTVMADLLRVGLPIGVTVAMEVGLFVAASLLIGRMGELEVAAHQIAINVAGLCFMIPFGLSEATTVRVGHALGRGLGAEGVRRAAFASLALVLVTQTLSASILLLGHAAVVRLYTADMAVAALASSLLLYAAAFQFPDGIQALAAGALRGLKDTRVPMFLVAFAYWCAGMPLGVLLALHFDWGPDGMWVGMIAGLSVAAVLLGLRFLRSSRHPQVVGPPTMADVPPSSFQHEHLL